jgi:hypothetical protein
MIPIKRFLLIIIFIFNAISKGWKVQKLEDGSFLFKKSLKDVTENVHADDFVDKFIDSNLEYDNALVQQ